MSKRGRRKRRLNTKVALMGSAVVVLMAVIVVVALLHFGGDPIKFIEDGDVAVESGNYELAARNYLKGLAVKEEDVQIDVLFKLAEVYAHLDQWPKVRGSWEGVLLRDPGNIKAALAVVQSLYQRAHSQTRVGWSAGDIWHEIETRSTKLLEVAQDKDVTHEDKSQWEIPAYRDETSRSLGQYLRFVIGRAAYEQARMGASSVPQTALAQAEAQFKAVIEESPDHVEAYWMLAQVMLEQGRLKASQGDAVANAQLKQEAESLLKRAIARADDQVDAHLYQLRLTLETYERDNTEPSSAELNQMESRYQALAQRFASSAEVFSAMSRFYWMCCFYRGPALTETHLNKAVEAEEKATALAPEHVEYAVTLARLYYRGAALLHKTEWVDKAIATAQKALTLPDAQLLSGPKAWANKANRLDIYTFLAHCTTDQLIEFSEGLTPSERSQWLAKSKESVRQIGQIIGSGDDPEVVKWNSILDIAEGRLEQGARQLYGLYEKAKGGSKRGQRDPHLAYMLLYLYKDTPEVGMSLEFVSTALEGGYGFSKPEIILDYLDILGRMDMWAHVISSVNPFSVDAYEKRFGETERSQALRVQALIHTNRISMAQSIIDRLDPEDATTLRLRLVLLTTQIRQLQSSISQQRAINESALSLEGNTSNVSQASMARMQQELDRFYDQLLSAVEKGMAADVTIVDDQVLSLLCDKLIQDEQWAKARDLVNKYLVRDADSAIGLWYRERLNSSQGQVISEHQRSTITEQAIQAINDPMQRYLEAGFFNLRHDQRDGAVEALLKVLEQAEQYNDRPTWGKSLYEHPAVLAAGTAMDILLQIQDWSRAETLADQVSEMNLDGCEGALFKAQLALARQDYAQAHEQIDHCLEQRPVFGRGYMVRARIKAAQNKMDGAVEDMSRATLMNPLDATIAKVHAQILAERNEALGSVVTDVQVDEAQRALEQAVRLNPSDTEVLTLYADRISDSEPLKAVAIYQGIQRTHPTLDHTVALGTLATSLAQQQADGQKQHALFEIARRAFEQAYDMQPSDRSVLYGYAKYYRAVGQVEQAEALLKQAEDETLLWRYFVGQGKIQKARDVLENLYQQQPRDADALKGLILVAEITNDREGLQRYFAELIAVEDTRSNRFDQIAVYLKIGLTEEAESLLKEFQKRYAGDPKVTLLEGWLALRQGQLDQARDLIDQALDKEDDNALAWFLKGRVSVVRGDYQEAIVGFRRSYALRQDDATRLSLARAYSLAGRDSDAITELEAMAKQPNAPINALNLLERIYARTRQTRQLSLFYKTMVDTSANPVTWCLRAGSFETQQGHDDLAVQWFQKAYEIKRDQYTDVASEVWSRDIQYREVVDQYLGALVRLGTQQAHDLTEVLEQGSLYKEGPFASAALSRMAEAKFKQGDRTAALEYAEASVDQAGVDYDLAIRMIERMKVTLGGETVAESAQQRLHQADSSIQGHLARFVLARDDREFDRALESLDQCVDLAGSDDSKWTLLVYRAQLLTEAYNATMSTAYLRRAISDYQSLLSKMPTNISVLNNLAYLMAVNDVELDDALNYAKRAVDLSPDSPTLMDTYGFVLHKNAEHNRALALLSAASQQFEYSGSDIPFEVYEHLGMVREALGQADEALASYQQALQVGAGDLPEAAQERIRSAIGRLSQ